MECTCNSVNYGKIAQKLHDPIDCTKIELAIIQEIKIFSVAYNEIIKSSQKRNVSKEFYIYIYVCVCVYVYVYIKEGESKDNTIFCINKVTYSIVKVLNDMINLYK